MKKISLIITHKMNTLNLLIKKYTAKNDEPTTHTSIVGGKYNITPDIFNDFYMVYYKEVIQENKPAFLVERVHEQFKFFLDIEGKEEEGLDDDIVQEIIAEYMNILEETCFIVSKRKNRYHVHFWEYITDTETSLKMYERVSDKYKKYIDTSVYKSGLRMLGSFKNKTAIEFEDSYHIYDIQKGVYKNYITFQEFCKSSILFDIPNLKPIQKQNKVITAKTNSKYTKEQEILEKLKEYNPKVLPADTKLVSVSEKTFELAKVTFLVTSSKFCPLINREHTRDSNPVYILLTNSKAYMKCHDSDCKSNKFLLNTGEIFALSEDILKTMNEVFPITHFSVANIIFKMYKTRFRVDSLKYKNWYEFDGIKWKPSNSLDIIISTEVVEYIKKYIVHLEANTESESDGGESGESKVENERCKYLKKLIIDLQTVGYKTSILSQLAILYNFYDPDFIEKLDANPKLMAFENGVYDFNELKFRKTRDTDYISYTTKQNYTPFEELDTTELQSFLNKIIPKKDIQIFLLKVLAKAISCTRDEKMYFWTGIQGSNGKSTLVSLLELAFGDYTMPVETTLLTSKRSNPGAVSPHLIVLKGRRLITMQETDNNDGINVGVMKQYSGNDTITARDLFKPTVRFKLQAKMIMCSNFPPIIDSQDGGTKRRIVYIEFTSKFCEKPTKPNEFAIDPRIQETLERLAPIFSNLIIHYYQLYLKEGNTTPNEVSLTTDMYNTENDKFGVFLDNYSFNATAFTSVTDLYSKFSINWIENLPNIKVPDIREFKKALKMKFGRECSFNRMKGYKILENDTDLVESDIEEL